jgi:hypothetical protein
MKSTEVLKVMAQTLDSTNLHSTMDELNKILKDKKTPQVKFRIAGKNLGNNLGHLGFTGLIKNITPEGLKVFNIGKVILIRFEDIELFEKAKPRVPRHTGPKLSLSDDENTTVEDSPEPSHDNDKLTSKKIKNKKPVLSGKFGSKFIPRG